MFRVEGDSDLSQSGAVMGTASYMPPEQAHGQTKTLTVAADVYSLGAILYELFTGRPPFRGATVHETLTQVISQPPTRPRLLAPKLDRDLETICLKCLEKTPDHRYASAEALADDLDRWLRGEPIAARPATAFEHASKWARRRPVIAALCAAVVFVSLIGIAGIVWQWRAALRNVVIARKEADRARRFAYVARINLAQRDWDDGNVAHAREILSDLVPKGADELDCRGFEWHYLNRRWHSERVNYKGHSAPVMSVAFSPDGRRIASGSEDSTVKVWDAASGQEILTFEGHTRDVTSVAFSPDGRRIASAGWDETVKMWDAGPKP